MKLSEKQDKPIISDEMLYYWALDWVANNKVSNGAIIPLFNLLKHTRSVAESMFKIKMRCIK